MTWKEEFLKRLTAEERKVWEEAGERNRKVYEHKGVEWFTDEDIDDLKKQIKEVSK